VRVLAVLPTVTGLVVPGMARNGLMDRLMVIPFYGRRVAQSR
jgi:hypothetical protein